MIKLTKNIRNVFKNKTILVTGGTGSIGLSLVKQLKLCNPKLIKILTNDENSIFEARRIIKEGILVKFILGDIRDKERCQLVTRGVDIVFHTAAMKHIDICEQNPFDAVNTNVIGTSNLLESSIVEGVSKFIFISTDKATNPTSTLGASKLLAERLTLDAGAYSKMICTVARFGNVIGSRGSVFQIFNQQLKNNEAITVTDKKMTRFITSIPDAASLILKIAHIGKNSETFILKTSSVKIEEFAQTMLEVYKKQNKNLKTPKIKIGKRKDRERFYELLLTQEELGYCHDMGDMYKISSKENKRNLQLKEFNSSTAKQISTIKLIQIIKELFNEIV